MPRPQGEIRQVLAEAVARLVAERGLVVDGVAVDGVTWLDVAHASCVGCSAARATLKNMRRAGELAVVGRRKAATSPHWLALYVPASLAGLPMTAES